MVMVAESHPRSLFPQSPSLQFPTMIVKENLVTKKFKIKVGSRGVRVESEKESDVLMNDECDNKKLTMKIKVKVPLQGHPNKRKPDATLNVQEEKRRKMDQSVKQQCGTILKELMTHKNGWAFNQPVDPITYGIPDYFSIITKPMDLGTIKSKLENNVYTSENEFAADVRLTFSNCMSYNPPHNDFHGMAKELNNIFNQRWKFLGQKLTCESKKGEQQSISNGKSAPGILHTYRDISPSNRRTMSLEERQKLRKELKEMLQGKMPEKLQRILKKFNLCGLKERIDVDINAIDDETLWEFKGMLKSSLRSTPAKVEPAKTTKSGGCPLSGKVINKGMGSGSKISNRCANAPMGSVDSKCGSCGCLSCQCSLQISNTNASSSDLSSEGSLQQDLCGVSKIDCDAKDTTVSCTKVSDSNGDIIEEIVCRSPGFSICGSTAVFDEGWTPPVDVRLSPKKALRAAMLKSRFADTIFKATHNSLLNQGDKVDLVKLQQVKEKLEKQQRKEKARIEAQIVATEAASRLRAEAEMRMQRQRAREAARIALQQMEKTVEIDENLKILKDVEMLSRTSMSEAALERFGLYIKEDFMEDVEEEAILNEDGEEGEIV